MSAFGTKRTSRPAQPMSAFGGKADITRPAGQQKKEVPPPPYGGAVFLLPRENSAPYFLVLSTPRKVGQTLHWPGVVDHHCPPTAALGHLLRKSLNGAAPVGPVGGVGECLNRRRGRACDEKR